MEFNVYRRQNLTPTMSKTSATEQIQIIMGDVNKLPTLPDSATRAMAIANDPNSSLLDLARFVERDPPMAAAILKLVNSPLYQTGRQINSLDQAVVRVGMRQCHNLIVAVGMMSMFKNVKPRRRILCEQLWAHSFSTAIICRRLNAVIGANHNGEEFTVGLLHDLGRILIAVACPETQDEELPIDLFEGSDVMEQERDRIGGDHCTLGAWFAMQNKLPGSVVSTIRFHHEPEHATAHADLVHLLATAEGIANQLHLDKPLDYDLSTNRGYRLLSDSWDDEQKESFVGVLPALIEEAIRTKGQTRGVLS